MYLEEESLSGQAMYEVVWAEAACSEPSQQPA